MAGVRKKLVELTKAELEALSVDDAIAGFWRASKEYELKMAEKIAKKAPKSAGTIVTFHNKAIHLTPIKQPDLPKNEQLFKKNLAFFGLNEDLTAKSATPFADKIKDGTVGDELRTALEGALNPFKE